MRWETVTGTKRTGWRNNNLRRFGLCDDGAMVGVWSWWKVARTTPVSFLSGREGGFYRAFSRSKHQQQSHVSRVDCCTRRPVCFGVPRYGWYQDVTLVIQTLHGHVVALTQSAGGTQVLRKLL